MDEIEFEIPYLPKTPNQLLRKSYWAVTNEKNKIKKLVDQVLPGTIPGAPWSKAKLFLIRYSTTEPDFDGLCSSFKFLVDSLIGRVIIDDSMSVTGPWEVSWQKTKKNKGKCYVKVLKVSK